MIEEDEINLRPYIDALMRHWKMIVGVTVAAAVLAAGVSLASPASYEATSIVAVTSLGGKPVPDIKSYLDLATSEDVLIQLSEKVGPSVGGALLTTGDLRGMLKASAGSDPSLINLKVVDGDAERTAALAKGWAEQFVQTADSTFNPAKDSYDQLQAQLTSARNGLRQAQQQLADIQSRSQLQILQAELDAKRSNLGTLYNSKAALQVAEENADSLRSRLQQLSPGTPGQSSDDSAIMLIQSGILGVSTQFQISTATAQSDQSLRVGVPSSPLQVQVPEQGNRTVGTQLAELDGIITLIHDRQQGADKQIAALQPSIIDLETKVSQIQSEQASLIAQRDGLNAALRDLETKTSQAKATLDAKSGQPRVIAATPVATPQGRGTTRNMALAVMLGLMCGIAIAFGTDYLKSRRQPMKNMVQPAIQS